MARLAFVPASRLSDRLSRSMVTPAEILSSGVSGPMTPVEPMRTADAGIFSCRPTSSAVFSQSSMPLLPVPAFAMPELTTTACTGDFAATMSISHLTGAAFTILLVKVPATQQGTSE